MIGLNPAALAMARELEATLVKDTQPAIDRIKLLSHYTTTTALASILRTNELWFSSARDMNDIDEVKKATAVAADILGNKGREYFKGMPAVATSAQAHFARFRTAMDQDTYVFSLSDHGRVNEEDRVAMWSEYGRPDGTGLCLVFKKTSVLDQNAGGKFPAKWSPIIYETPEQLATRIETTFGEIDAIFKKYSCLFNSATAGQMGLLVAMCLVGKVFTYKHISFEFEREVRFVHTAPLQFGPLPRGVSVRNVETQNGPKALFVLPLRNYPEFTVDARISSLIDHVIVQPSDVKDERVREVRSVLAAHNLGHVPVRASNSPYRPKKGLISDRIG